MTDEDLLRREFGTALRRGDDFRTVARSLFSTHRAENETLGDFMSRASSLLRKKTVKKVATVMDTERSEQAPKEPSLEVSSSPILELDLGVKQIPRRKTKQRDRFDQAYAGLAKGQRRRK